VATEVIWWILAAAVAGTSLGVVTSGSVIHSAIFLILSLAGVGGMYAILTVEFMALVQFLIYGGAVTVLILLALMLTRTATSDEPLRLNGPQTPFAVLVGLILMAVLIGVGVSTNWPGATDAPTQIDVPLIGERLFVDFGPTFVIASVLLLVAMIGAIILARQEDAE
jgi:NADH:ubiquinone oxidoreductase subunit 6 (subunit J)